MNVAAVEPGEQALVEWVTPALTIKRGRDPLGLQTITLDRIMPTLLPGVLALSQRARYLAIYPFLLAVYEERRLAADNASLGEFIRHREYELCLAMQMCARQCGAAHAIGSDRARPEARAQPEAFARRLSVESPTGGYGLYYRSPLVDLDVVAPAGSSLGDSTTRVDVLARTDHAQALASAFRQAIAHTTYAKEHLNGIDPIPRAALEELAEHACLCRLDDHPIERQAIRDTFFRLVRQGRADEVEQRRRGFAMFLGQLDKNPDVAEDDSSFRRGTIDAFHADPAGEGPSAEAHAAWGGLAMKECVQEAICSLWTEFCRRGLEVQEHDGMTSSELHQFITGDLAGAGELKVAGRTLTWEPGQPLSAFREDLLAAAADMHWEETRAWTAQANTAVSGLAAILWFEEHAPNPADVLPPWEWIARQDSEHQYGMLRSLMGVRRLIATQSTVAEALEWALRTFVIGPHEVIAYSKLPESTFRFCWEEGRLCFYPTGHDRFATSGARRNALSSLSQDMGLWERDGDEDKPQLTDAGRSFLTEVFT